MQKLRYELKFPIDVDQKMAFPVAVHQCEVVTRLEVVSKPSDG